MIEKLFSYSKIIGGLLFSYLIVNFFTSVFFIGNSPLLRPHPEQYLAEKVTGKIATYLAQLNIGKTNEKATLISIDKYKEYISSSAAKGMKQVATGTYAADIQGQNVQIIKVNEIPTKVYSYTLKDGRQIQVSVPVDSTPPTQAEVEQ